MHVSLQHVEIHEQKGQQSVMKFKKIHEVCISFRLPL